ncbi:MAG TPA: hypothetical protein V6C91_08175 [Coleofasciculaceae cyanobacterium]
MKIRLAPSLGEFLNPDPQCLPINPPNGMMGLALVRPRATFV